ncbi:hypothetical protein B0T10DRAFT_579769 [Thelonectria olida]|uniref:Short chain dehydrogenase family protein n=1 Tax=Thelonectria olida TaxID=1576542 RepID=A0A9P8VYW1_9HYPO|nr:hypothetical protein B0T10DRAFT_579769 [Thelonectria olida]
MPSHPTRPIALITGANQGIGLAVAKILATEHSYHVLIGSRNPQAGEKVALELQQAGQKASTIQLDLESPASIEQAISRIERDFGYLDVLVNNAGVLLDLNHTLGTWDMFTKTFTTNVVGTATLTEGLLPLLSKSKVGPPRIVFVTSLMGSFERATDKTTMYYNTDYKAYDASKASVNMLMLNYARILEGTGAKVNSVCPGLVRTALTGYTEYGHSPEVGASRIVELATLGEDGPTGTVSDRNGPLPW